ncbi:DUF4232 domain-containing protein [Nocardia altamirensis]|uniref:DUF4232 domain-containing protein n=1 Tax=Nocardia altamirensis TaxID=472158 RepID=UPI0008402A63|nr:DUF4232 domain-containing protein [Nocardia altamirensis]
MRGTALVVLAAALSLAACTDSSPGPSTTASPVVGTPAAAEPTPNRPPPPSAPKAEAACTAADLDIALGRQGGAAGSIYVPVVFTNTGNAPCTLSGYPDVSLAAGTPPTPLGPAADHKTDSTAPAPVTLAPTEAAHATLRYAQAGNFDCERTPAQYLLVSLPAQPSRPLPFPVDACTKPAHQLLHVDPIKPGKQD